MTAEYLSAVLFMNFEQALGFGHIAWGVEISPGQYFFGSTDHLLRRPMWDIPALMRYAAVRPGDNTDYWSRQASFEEMLDEMTHGPHIRYHAYKCLPVPAALAAPAEAKTMGENLRDQGWTLWQNNCVHQTDRIVKVFGAAEHVRAAKHALTPQKYFALAQGQPHNLGLAKTKVRSCF